MSMNIGKPKDRNKLFNTRETRSDTYWVSEYRPGIPLGSEDFDAQKEGIISSSARSFGIIMRPGADSIYYCKTLNERGADYANVLRANYVACFKSPKELLREVGEVVSIQSDEDSAVNRSL